MNIEYHVQFSIDLGAALPSVGDVLKHVNDTYESITGSSDKLVVRGKLFSATITSERELTKEDIEKMKTILLDGVRERFPKHDIQIESFRRKSGNALQLVVQ